MSLGKYQIPLGSLPQKAKETLSNDVINSDFLDFRNAKEVSTGSIYQDGIYRNNSNQVLVKCSTVMKGVTPKMVDWWFAWHMSKSERYKLWHPRDHISAELKEDRSSFKSDKEKYIGVDSYVKEYIGKELNELCISFSEPASFGFIDLNVNEETAICAHVRDLKRGLSVASINHHAVQKEEGFSLMHSTFWLGMDTKFINPLLDLVLKPIANLKLTRKFLISDQLAKNLMLHCYEEMHHLSGFLPSLYKDKNPY